MNKFITASRSSLTQLALIASYGVNRSLFFCTAIDIISSLQIEYIILRTSVFPTEVHQAIIFKYLKSLASFVGFLDIADIIRTNVLVLSIWLIISLYLLVHVIFVIFSAVTKINDSKTRQIITRTCTHLTLIHSKVFFCLIYYFYLSFLNWQEEYQLDSNSLLLFHPSLTYFTFVFLAINMFLASIKEFFFYQIYYNKNTMAVKTNLHAIIQLIHKTLLVPLIIFKEQNEVVNSTLNFLLTLGCLIVLFINLPIYNIKFLKSSIILSTTTTASSFFLLWKIIVPTIEIRTLEFLIILCTPLLIKLMLQQLNKIFYWTLGLRISSPNCIVQLSSILNDYDFLPVGMGMKNNNVFQYKKLFNLGFIKAENVDISDPGNTRELKEYKNRIIMNEILKCYRGNPRSITILLCVIKFHLEKIKNVYHALAYMQKLQELSGSPPIAAATVYLKNLINEILSKTAADDSQSLNFTKYFKYKELSAVFKDTIQAEVDKHIDFWNNFSREKVDVYKILQKSESLDAIAVKIKKFWKENEKDLINNFPVPLLLYRVYLSLIRNTPGVSQNLLNRSAGQNCRLLESMEKWFSQERAMIVASNQKGALGKILDASYSVKNLFNIEKQDLVGRKINLLMPRMIQEKHDTLIHRYNEKPLQISSRRFSVYCKTIDGSFFPATLALRIYPYIEKGVGLIGIFNKTNECLPAIFIDTNGTILDCSRDLLAKFNLNFYMAKEINIKEIAPELEKVNRAFNMIYSVPIQLKEEKLEISMFNSVRSENQMTEGVKKNLLSEISPTALESPTFQKENILLISDRYLNPETESLSSKKISDNPGLQLFCSANNRLPMTMNECEMICEKFKEGSTVIFNASQSILEETKGSSFIVKVEPFFFEKKLYKVIWLKKSQNNDQSCLEQYRGPKKILISNIKNSNDVKDLRKGLVSGRNGNIAKETSWKVPDKVLSSESCFSLSEKSFEKVIDSVEALSLSKNKGIKKEFVKRKKAKSDEHDAVSQLIENTFIRFYQKETSSNPMRLYSFFIYFALLLMITLATVDFITTKASFKQVELGLKLVNLDSERLVNIFQTWTSCNAMFLFLVGGRPFPTSFFSPTTVKDQTQVINQIERGLVSLLSEIESENVIKAFFTKTISLWEPGVSKQIGYFLVDAFTATHLILQNLALLKNENANLIKSNPNLVKFGLNNTVNDLLLNEENELGVMKQYKKDIYADNIFLLKVLMSVHSISITMVILSLLILMIWITRSYQHLFKALSTIPPQVILNREKDLMSFKTCLQKSVESIGLAKGLNSLLDEHAEKEKDKDNEKRTTDKEEAKFNYERLKFKTLAVFGLGLVLFMLILCLFLLSNALSTQHIERLQQIDRGSTIAETMGYQVYLQSANFIYYMIFYNQTSMLLRNEAPGKQLEKNLKSFFDLNSLLTAAFSDETNKIYDSDIQRLLLKDICSFIDQAPSTQSLCLGATKGALGLIGVNLQYHHLISSFLELFRANPTYDNYYKMIGTYLDQIKYFGVTIDKGFRFLRTRLLTMLLSNIEEQNINSRDYLAGICVTCFLVTLLVRSLVLSYFNSIDKLRYKILRLFPKTMILGNKALLYYLKREFPKDFAEIKSVL